MPVKSDIVALILAAGRGERFGGDKRRVVLEGGAEMLTTSARCALQTDLPVYVAIREGDTEDKLPLPNGVHRLRIDEADAGMGATLAGAVAVLPESCRGCLVLLADMPWLQPATLRRVADALRAAGPAGLVAPQWQGERGHPVGFGCDWFAELQGLTGDRGARDLLRREQARLQLLTVDDPGVVADVDTVADLIKGPPRSPVTR